MDIAPDAFMPEYVIKKKLHSNIERKRLRKSSKLNSEIAEFIKLSYLTDKTSRIGW